MLKICAIMDIIKLLKYLENNMYEYNIAVKLLEKVTTQEEFDNIFDYIQCEIQDPIHCLTAIEEVILSALFYYNCSNMIHNKNTIIVDCGSSIPIWQYFFKDFNRYIAIDCSCDFDAFLKPLSNAHFIKGRIEDVLPDIVALHGNHNVVGISRLCCSYHAGSKAIEEFNKLKFKITL